MTSTNPRLPVHAPTGTELTARSWQTEGPLRMLMNNLDPANAERPEDLVVYGGTGKAARSWEAYDALVRTLTTLGDDDKRVKTEGSMRVVPVHNELVKLGFLDYHAGMKEAGQSRLFPLAERNSRGQMIADFSREFGRYLIRLGMKTGRGLSLYSFRHGAADALRRAGHLDENFGFILGHTKASTTGIYGIMPQGILEQRVELVNAIRYPNLSLNHLCEP